jgi:nucleoside-diphosphate-sugar epimerase
MRVLVSGASGRFARALLPALCAHPGIESVTGLDTRAPPFEHSKLRAARLDLTDASLPEVVAGHDALIHLPPFASPRRALPVTTADAAVRPAHKLFHTASAAGVRRLIHMSTAAVYGEAVHAGEQAPAHPLPGFAYAEQQAHLEQLLAIDFPQCVRLRPHLIVGPHAHPAIRRVLGQPFYPRAPGPPALFQCVHEDDLAAAVLLCLSTDARGAYNIATEDSFSLRDALRARHGLSIGLSPSTAEKTFEWGSRLLRLDLERAWVERASHTLLVNCRRALIDLGWRRVYTAVQALAAT